MNRIQLRACVYYDDIIFVYMKLWSKEDIHARILVSPPSVKYQDHHHHLHIDCTTHTTIFHFYNLSGRLLKTMPPPPLLLEVLLSAADPSLLGTEELSLARLSSSSSMVLAASIALYIPLATLALWSLFKNSGKVPIGSIIWRNRFAVAIAVGGSRSAPTHHNNENKILSNICRITVYQQNA